MTVVYKPIDGEQVSEQWWVILTYLRNVKHVQFHVNEGHRTWARQEELVREKGLWSPSNMHGAAAPSANAPHIRTGRLDHAIDFDNSTAVIYALSQLGVIARRTVPGESWHLEVAASDLVKLAAKLGGSSDPTLKQGQMGPSVVRLKKLLYSAGIRHFTSAHSSSRYVPYFSKWTAAAVRRFQRAHGMSPDGIVGPKTWAALRKAAG